MRDGSGAGLQPAATEIVHKDDEMAEHAKVLCATLVHRRCHRWSEAVASRDEGDRGVRARGVRSEGTILRLRLLAETGRRGEKQQCSACPGDAANSRHFSAHLP